jgi:hypothetical protein
MNFLKERNGKSGQLDLLDNTWRFSEENGKKDNT